MNKVLAVYIPVYMISILLIVYGLMYSERLIRSGICLVIAITPPFIVSLYTKKKK